ncbi:MAG: hypothetical protein IJK38_10810 [Oscillospiraceae bacterium]|nr:hypothetical protein [Oscillospiraceae bacterium]MBR3017529.1 hypothetical protein [Clostridia bacterium]MBR6861951.1 hypothetical protein [Acidaminococcaceae bacterium]
MYRLDQKPKKKHDGAEKWRAYFTKLNPLGEIRMLSVHPQCGIRMIGRYSDEAFDIFSDDEEAIFYLQPDNIFLSCLTSDLIRIGKRVYLMGDAVAYKLNREDDYADMSSDEMAETCLELMERMQRVRMGQFCFSVIDLTDEIKEDRFDEEE